MFCWDKLINMFWWDKLVNIFCWDKLVNMFCWDKLVSMFSSDNLVALVKVPLTERRFSNKSVKERQEPLNFKLLTKWLSRFWKKIDGQKGK